ncbi:hypothetical protein GCM10010954_12360 [Halobacillus andaensis]|uniref:Uncharacterized protein n=1 Tax=Halobacillus andaensis TaxID=1176239 RepID=A0A917ETV4_HALAA|nr:hypothetical protein [Halobacillus andaensis]MBP2004031.1 hypothetical protein [Halobacillus andaensis]GGF15271.1 hypothetical protein GCM10010954_12360 [Halobacillus andaensis]
MGYILPIQHYQYQDYQQRVTSDERSPFALDRVFKVTLDHKLKEYYTPREQDRKNSQYLHHQLHTPKTVHYNEKKRATDLEEKVYSEVTGKGQRFSETI